MLRCPRYLSSVYILVMCLWEVQVKLHECKLASEQVYTPGVWWKSHPEREEGVRRTLCSPHCTPDRLQKDMHGVYVELLYSELTYEFISVCPLKITGTQCSPELIMAMVSGSYEDKNIFHHHFFFQGSNFLYCIASRVFLILPFPLWR